jgi:hypothetical protein
MKLVTIRVDRTTAEVIAGACEDKAYGLRARAKEWTGPVTVQWLALAEKLQRISTEIWKSA